MSLEGRTFAIQTKWQMKQFFLALQWFIPNYDWTLEFVNSQPGESEGTYRVHREATSKMGEWPTWILQWNGQMLSSDASFIFMLFPSISFSSTSPCLFLCWLKSWRVLKLLFSRTYLRGLWTTGGLKPWQIRAKSCESVMKSTAQHSPRWV